MFYREYPPPAALSDYIQCFWALEHDYRDSMHSHEHLWADTQIELIFSYGERYYRQMGGTRYELPEDFIIGPFKKELLLYSGGLTGFVAVRFHPWGFAAFSKVKMAGLINSILPVEAVLDEPPRIPGQSAPGQLTQQLDILGGWFSHRLRQRGVKPVAVLPIAREIRAKKGVVKIAALAEEFSVNPRQLERLFLSEIGLSAKMFARILRFNHAKRLIEQDPGISLASLTYETGYADQAHFSNNFREMFGHTPAQFKALMQAWRQKSAGQAQDVVFLQDNS
jgi:AraC-like DNA-binding protein